MAGPHFKKHLIHQATIQRTTPVQSGSGELIDAWAAVDTVDCRFVQKEERIASEGVSLQMIQVDLLLMNQGEDILEKDQVIDIVFKSSGASVDAGPFTVESLVGRNSTGSHHLSVRLERVE